MKLRVVAEGVFLPHDIVIEVLFQLTLLFKSYFKCYFSEVILSDIAIQCYLKCLQEDILQKCLLQVFATKVLLNSRWQQLIQDGNEIKPAFNSKEKRFEQWKKRQRLKCRVKLRS